MWRERASFGVVVLFLAAAAYELAVVSEWIGMGRDPGDDPPGQAAATVAALIAVAATIALGVRHPRGKVFALIPLSAAAWMVAHYYAFDPYFFPSKRRFADGGMVSSVWIYAMVVVGLGVCVAAWRSRTAGGILVPVFVLVAALTVVAEGIGH
jgi:hypothetical protein